ncbi:EF-P beta-lysylation protein EpmB [Acinetobacter qingfengensis]|uniref:L-lysine 2,3-aminomutase n=1 Tax=Acinetobacter qingfengensis TaxID=1262585 RepID=A0A1E7R969_9GAMM|nr:EF-P beta-lysylation protein EpmB [Acinetobacter qingfengensis]KAA8735513.1 EF-P beta-lysylation protein EpmB [Acinetobacter qingfengensis]OEY95841.1 EF-P beta-lysylation protein EpmB [Acinetobacter qingfengensis]
MINYLFQEKNWQSQLNDLITDPFELISLLELSPEQLDHQALLANKQFKLRVPRQFVEKIQIGNPHDPLLLQVLPHHLEMQALQGFSLDPLGERDANALPGILHKYKSRLLLTLTGACAIHCRYCFRRHFPYQENLPKEKDWLPIKKYLLEHPDVNEIILSGGDPLSVSNEKLARWIQHFEELSQIKTLRIHSRLPVVIPQRIDQDFLDILQNTHLKLVMVVHSNHPQELDQAFDDAMSNLIKKNVMLFNQSVLLKGINDNSLILSDLSYRLFHARVLPYYLHVLDKVSGSGHFLISDIHAQKIYQAILKELPGYLVPKLVREIHGELHKTPLNIF